MALRTERRLWLALERDGSRLVAVRLVLFHDESTKVAQCGAVVFKRLTAGLFGGDHSRPREAKAAIAESVCDYGQGHSGIE